MNDELELRRKLENLAKNGGSFPVDTYQLVMDAVKVAVHEKSLAPNEHISGQELLKILIKLAQMRFGPLAWEVLSSWKIQETMDFGRAVFEMVDAQILGVSSKDSLEDFKSRGSLQEKLRTPFYRKPPYPDMPSVVK